jgi:lipoprotein signal peptidase
MQIGKKHIKYPLFSNDVFKMSKVFNRRPLNLIYTFNKVAGYSIKRQKSVCFYTPTIMLVLKSQESNPFHNRLKRNS